MSTGAPIARHRADSQSLATIAKAVSSNAGSMGRQAAVIAAASGMVLTTGLSSTAAEVTTEREATATSALQAQTVADVGVSVPAEAKIAFDRPDVKSTAAPVVSEPEPAPAPKPAAAPQPNEVGTVTSDAPTAQPEPAAQTQQAASTTVQSQGTAQPQSSRAEAKQQEVQSGAKAPASSTVGAGIASAAYAQVGVHQDCTMLVTNALAAVGINHHGWPDSYFSLGTQVSAGQAQPGDLVYYADGGMGMAHIAVYVGNGQAVHGGWDGGNTVVDSVNIGSGPVYIRVNG